MTPSQAPDAKHHSNFSLLIISNHIDQLLPNLTHYFSQIHIAVNSEDALALFEKNEIDLVFVDTDVEDLNWLSLVHKLRQTVYDIAIVPLITLNNPDRLTTLISIGISQCLIKPFTPAKLQHVIDDMIIKLQQKKDAKELFYLKEQQTKHDLETLSALQIIQGIPFPIFAFQNDKILFANTNLYSLFSAKKIDTTREISLSDIESLFENTTDQHHFSTLKQGKSLEIHYHYTDTSLKKVFVATKMTLASLTNDEAYSIVFLQDIAPHLMQIKMMAYQNNKVESYKNLIEELLARRIFKESSQAITKTVQSVFQENSLDQMLNVQELSILRKSTSFKIDAQDYIANLDASSYDDVFELGSLTKELQSEIEFFSYEPTQEAAMKVAQLFEMHGKVVKSLLEFVDLGNAICSLLDYIKSLNEDDIQNNAAKIESLFSNLLEDLIQWRINIFETKVAVDIHYLDSSIFSSILQLQLNISDDPTPSDDFELF